MASAHYYDIKVVVKYYKQIMVLILDGNSEIGAHVWSEIVE